MAAIRSFSRLLASRTLNTITKRGYADEMSLTFAAGNQVFYDSVNVKQVDVPSFSGSFGILPKHVPLLAVLKPGVVTVYENDGKTKKVFVSSGTITINDDSSVQVLAEEACTVDQLDVSRQGTFFPRRKASLIPPHRKSQRLKLQSPLKSAALVKACE